jgi:photosystem II stability/assembly factor-like uncharacterized protein
MIYTNSKGKGVGKMLNKDLRTFKFLVIVFLALLIFPTSSISQSARVWSNLGLYGGQIYDIAIDPSNPDKMFIGSHLGDGLFVSIDGGEQWEAVAAGEKIWGEDTFKNHAVWAIEIALSNSNVIWAVHNVWAEKSTDGGQTWTHILNGDMQRDCAGCGGAGDDFRFCRSLAIDPVDPNIVYVGTGGPLNTYALGAIYKTENGGATWTKVVEFDHTVVDLDIDPQNSNVIWAATSSFGYGGWAGKLYRSLDGGTSWEVALDLGPSGSGYATVAAKPGDPNIAFSGSGFGIIKHWYDNDLGTWNYLTPLPQSRLVEDISFDPQNSNIVYAVWLRPTGWGGDGIGKVGRSVDGGDTWTEDDIYSHDYDFISISVHPTNSEILFAGDLSFGVNKSLDHGQTWTRVNEGVNAVIVYDVAIDPNDSTHIIAGTISGVYEKKEAVTWSQILPYITRSLQVHPTDSLTFYAGLFGQLAKTIDGGINWSYSNYLGKAIFDIAVDTLDRNTIFIATEYGEIHKSIDGGNTFEKVLDGVNQSGEVYSFNVIIIDPSDNQHVFAGGGNFYDPKVLGDLWESTDGGVNWTRTSLQNEIINSLLIDPRESNIIYAGCGYSGGTLVPIYKSTDGGANWNPSYEGIPDIRWPGKSVWGTSPTNVYAVGSNSPFYQPILHYDGRTWLEIDTGSTEGLFDIWGLSEDYVFAVGDNGTILHYDGNTWSAMSSGSNEDLYGVWGSSQNDVFAVGDNGTILHYNGNTWSAMSSGNSEDLFSIWGSSRDNVFAVGTNGTILNFKGMAWSQMNSGTTERLLGVWGATATDIFTVGSSGTILRYDGLSWTSKDSGITADLEDIWGVSAIDVFVVGDGGLILHYDGNTLTTMDTGTTEKMWSVWGTTWSDAFAVGDEGRILHYDGNTWTVSRRGGKNWNSVTDLEFHPMNKNIVYAATPLQGVYISPNQADNWLNLGTPDYTVNAISTSSLFAGAQGGIHSCTGTGLAAGHVYDAFSMKSIHDALVFSDFGISTRSINGDFMMVSPSGIFDFTAVTNGYANCTKRNAYVFGGDVTWMIMAMEPGISDPEVQEQGSSGGSPSYCLIATATSGLFITEWLEMKFIFPSVCILIVITSFVRIFKFRLHN